MAAWVGKCWGARRRPAAARTAGVGARALRARHSVRVRRVDEHGPLELQVRVRAIKGEVVVHSRMQARARARSAARLRSLHRACCERAAAGAAGPPPLPKLPRPRSRHFRHPPTHRICSRAVLEFDARHGLLLNERLLLRAAEWRAEDARGGAATRYSWLSTHVLRLNFSQAARNIAAAITHARQACDSRRARVGHARGGSARVCVCESARPLAVQSGTASGSVWLA